MVWKNGGYREIRTSMEQAGADPVGVDLHTPDFVALANAYGLDAVSADDPQTLLQALETYSRKTVPVVIEIDETRMMTALTQQH